MHRLARIGQAVNDELYAATKGDRSLYNLLPILGPPLMPYNFNVEDNIAHERWSVESLYEGKNLYLENTLSSMIKQTYNPWVTEWIMPLVPYDDINFIWTKWTANRTLWPQTAVAAPPEHVTQSRTSMRTTMNRYELGFVVHAETLDNPEGQFALALDLVTVAMSLGDTVENLGLSALLNRKQYHRERLRRFHDLYANPADVFAAEKLFWDILRKSHTGDGFYTLCSEIKKAMNEIIPSDAIVPQGTRSLLATGDNKENYYLHGPGVRANIELGGDSISDTKAGLRIHTVREQTIETLNTHVSPLSRERTIGDTFVLADRDLNCAPESYTSCSLNSFIFNMAESRGVWSLAEFMTGVNFSHRFDGKGSLLPCHKDLAQNPCGQAQLCGLPISDKENEQLYDMFLYKDDTETNSYKVADVFGQMEEKFMPAALIRKIAESIAHKVRKEYPAADLELKAAATLIKRVHELEIKEGALNLLVPQTGARNEFGGHDVPENYTSDSKFGSFPAGYGTISGLYTIAAMNASSSAGKAIGEENIKRAQTATQAIDEVAQICSQYLIEEHPVMTGSLVPEHFTSAFPEGSQSQKEMHMKMSFANLLLDRYQNALCVETTAAEEQPELGGEIDMADISLVTRTGFSGSFADEWALPEEEEYDETYAAAKIATEMRAAVNGAASGAVLRAFSKEGHAAFLEAYKDTKLSRAIAAAYKERANRNFSLFATKALGPVLTAYKKNEITKEQVAQFVHNAITAVETNEPIETAGVQAKMQEWLQPPPSVIPTMGSSTTRRAETGAKRTVVTGLSASAFSLLKGRVTGVSMIDHTGQNIPLREAREVLNLTAILSGAERKYPKGSYRDGKKAFETAFGTKYPNIDLNVNLDNNIANILNKEKNTLLKACIGLVLLAPIHRDQLQRWFDHDIRMPVSVLGVRPFRRYQTKSVIFVAGGEQLGEIAWSKFDVHLASNAMTKEFRGNASVWMAPIIKREERYFIAEDVLVTQYLGGESMEPFDQAKQHRLDSEEPSILYFMIPHTSTLVGRMFKSFDIRGFFNPDLVEGRLTPAARGVIAGWHYPTALYYNLIWNFSGVLRLLSMDDSDWFSIQKDARYDNTVVHQTMQWIWNAKTKLYDRAILNTDHFGYNIYEGHGDLRTTGLSQHYKEFNYQMKFSPIAA